MDKRHIENARMVLFFILMLALFLGVIALVFYLVDRP
jgi:hypothetical protein